MANKLDINVRDDCAHLLIPLNKCRIATGFMPWKCDHERHTYEKCQYDDYKKRKAEWKVKVKEMQQ